MTSVAALIDAGVVVNVAALSGDPDSGWLTAMRARHDTVLIVPRAGVGWVEYEKGKVRPPAPYPSWTWSVTGWVAPVALPDDGPWVWDEPTVAWVAPAQSPVEARLTALEARLDRAAVAEVAGDAAKIRDAMKPS